MTMEKILAGIGLGILLWGGLPFAFWFYLGMGDRTDRAKKIYASIVLVLGIACMIITIDCLNSNWSSEHILSIVYAVIGMLCFLQRAHIYSRIEKETIEWLTKRMKCQQDNLDYLKKTYNTLESTTKDCLNISEFYRTYLDVKIIQEKRDIPFAFDFGGYHRVMKTYENLHGFIIEKNENSELSILIGKMFEDQCESDGKKCLDYFINNFNYKETDKAPINSIDSYLWYTNSRKNCTVIDNEKICKLSGFEKCSIIITDNYYILTGKIGERLQTIFNPNFRYSRSLGRTVILENDFYNLFAFDYANYSSINYTMKELLVVPSSGSEVWLFRKENDNRYSILILSNCRNLVE